MIKDLFKKARYISVSKTERGRSGKRADAGVSRLIQCPGCKKLSDQKAFENALMVCPRCGRHERLSAFERIGMVADPDSFVPLYDEIRTANPLSFPGYSQKVDSLKRKTGLSEAVVTGRCAICAQAVMLAVMDSRFLMASMGSVVGEKLTRLFEQATAEKLPVVLFAASGGARMQEGIHSLMQMAKVSGAVGLHGAGGGLYITVLTDPTTGGVTASFAMLGDVILAEPGALIGFTGRRVIEGTLRQRLPEGFQSAEFQRDHGFVDSIVPRAQLRGTLGKLLLWHKRKEQGAGLWV